MQEVSPESPEQRAKRSRLDRSLDHVRPGGALFEIIKRVLVGVYSDGFIHAGNLAYLALISLFPFFIVTAALAQFLDRGPDTIVAVENFLRTLPPAVAALLRQPIIDVLAQRTGSLLWLGALVGLWTVGSFIETIRDILRRAYGTNYSRGFWHYRLGSLLMIIISVVLVLTAFSAQVVLTAAEEFVYRLLPFASDLVSLIGLSRLAPMATLFVALYALFYTLTPAKYRYAPCPKWPGAFFTALWWVTVTMALPDVLALLGSYDLTYGSLAGVIIALFFFWLVGFGLVIGAHLNAALAETPSASVKGAPVQA
nr:YihY/virulence factor BrkB family protein [Sphingomonas oleivorans]